jgi:serine/threonine protein phosphatase PrpC
MVVLMLSTSITRAHLTICCFTCCLQASETHPDTTTPLKVSFGSHAIQNGRSHMEDRTISIALTGNPAFPGAARAGLAAVFDGHGGESAAEWLVQHMLPLILNQGPAALRDEPAKALTHAILAAEDALVAPWQLDSGHAAGSTLCLALLVDATVYVAHVGDSRAVLGTATKAVALTEDHKGSSSAEAARILAADPSAVSSADG